GQGIAADEILVSSFYAGYLNDVQDERVDAVVRQEARVGGVRAEAAGGSAAAAGARDTAEEARAKVAKTRAELQKARDERAAAKAAADTEAERQRQLVLQVEAKRADYENRLRALRSESARL